MDASDGLGPAQPEAADVSFAHDADSFESYPRKRSRTGAWELRPAEQAIRFSAEALQILGFAAPADGGSRTTPWDVIPEPERTRLEARIERARGDGIGFEAEFRFVTPAGESLWLGFAGTARGEGPHRHLSGVLQDLTDRHEYEMRLIDAATTERDRFATDLHDGLGQELTGIALMLSALRQRSSELAPALCPEIDRIGRLVSTATATTRQIAQGLAPLECMGGDLVAAVRQLALQPAAQGKVTLELTAASPAPLPGAAATQVYRIIQEALTNALRHAEAQHISIRCSLVGGTSRFFIEDDGRGFDRRSVAPGLGLHTMRYRADLIGAELDVASVPGRGTRIALSVPASRGST